VAAEDRDITGGVEQQTQALALLEVSAAAVQADAIALEI
jgi:hypothetical protein